jgi:tetratricopeptide (TPR) repeat protein
VAADYDIFVSHAWADGDRPRQIADALTAAGLRVWFDANEIDDFASITRAVTQGLARSKALLAYYSKTYPLRRACQWELTASFLAAQSEGDPRRRVLVINPERSADHIHPIELRDAKFRNAPTDNAAELHELAQSIAKHLSGIDGPFPSAGLLIPPNWYGITPVGSTRFTGRLEEMWKIHSLLHAGDVTQITGVAGATGGIGRVSGLGGVGKSLLAEEYALHFGAAYPGGIFWLRAYGNDNANSALDGEGREAERAAQIRTIAERRGINTQQLTATQIEGELAQEIERHGKACLWVVDDVPNGLNGTDLRRWFSPHSLARTLITTRSREYGALANGIDLSVLAPDEGYHLLTSRRTPNGEVEEGQAHLLTEDLGRHALALDLTASALVSYGEREPYREFREELKSDQDDALELAAELADALPTGHEPSIAQTFLRSVRSLGEEGQDFLRLASVLAAAPIPASVVTGVFKQVDDVDGDQAQRRQRRAFHDATSASLAEIAGEKQDARSVHTLVSRAVRFHEKRAAARIMALRSVAIEVLRSEIDRLTRDARPSRETESYAAHARYLTSALNTASEADLVGWLARYEYQRGAYAATHGLLSRELEFRRRVQGPASEDTLITMGNLAECLRAQGDLKGAQELIVETLSLQTTPSANTLALMDILGVTFEKQGHLAEAKWLHQTLLAMRGSILGVDHEHTLTSMNNLAEVLSGQGDLVGARKLQEDVLTGRRRVLGPGHPNTLQSMNNLASTLLAQGDLEGARKLQGECLRLRRELLELEHPDTLQSMNNQSMMLGQQGDFAGAKNLQEEALAISSRTLGPNHPETLQLANNLAVTLQRLSETTRARHLLEKVLLAQREQLGPEHLSTLTTMNNLAHALYADGDAEAARKLFEETLRTARRTLGSEHATTLQAMQNLAVLLWQHGNVSDARALNEEALAVDLRVFGLEHPHTTHAAWNLFGNLQERGDIQAASAVFRKYLKWLLDRDPSILNVEQREVRATLKRVVTLVHPPKSRNAPCPCGSGVKYKKCCGA